MNGMGAQAALAVVLLLFTATVKAQEGGGVSVWKKDVTMTCPESGKWFEKDTEFKVKDEDDQDISLDQTDYTFEYNGKATYRCEYPVDAPAGEEKKYYFYVEGKVCENCYELDAGLLGLVIVLDLVGTALLMVIIYTFTKTKSPAGPATVSSKAPARSGGRAAGGSEYESLNPQTRSQGTYAQVNRTG